MSKHRVFLLSWLYSYGEALRRGRLSPVREEKDKDYLQSSEFVDSKPRTSHQDQTQIIISQVKICLNPMTHVTLLEDYLEGEMMLIEPKRQTLEDGILGSRRSM